jgi:predicted nucleotidyltransferase
MIVAAIVINSLEMKQENLAESLKNCVKPVLDRHPIQLAYLYGSAARGQMTPLSDVDIALVTIEGAVAPKERLKFELIVEDEIVRMCSLSKADVRVINQAPLVIRGRVVTSGIVLYSRDESFRIEFEIRIRSEYFDFQPVLEFHRQTFFKDVLERGISGRAR